MAILDSKGKVMSDAAIKREVMRVSGWTSKQYEKEYDKLRNRVRNYEVITGEERGKIKVNELLFQTSKASAKHGEKYRPSALVRAIRATPSAGTGTVQRGGVSEKTLSRLVSEVEKSFSGLIKKDRTSRETLERLKKEGGAGVVSNIKKALSSRAEELKTIKKATKFTPRWFYE